VAVADKLTPNQVRDIKNMGREAGRVMMKLKYPQLTLEEMDEFDKVWKDNQQPATIERSADPHRRTFIAVAWLLGASLRQLGRKYSVTPQTIMQQLDRAMMHIPDRNAIRLMQPPIESWKLEALHELFYQLAQASFPPFYSNMSLLQTATAMHMAPLDTQKFQPDEAESTYGELQVRENRLGDTL
jgi:hypothetical protein